MHGDCRRVRWYPVCAVPHAIPTNWEVHTSPIDHIHRKDPRDDYTDEHTSPIDHTHRKEHRDDYTDEHISLLGHDIFLKKNVYVAKNSRGRSLLNGIKS